MTSPSPSGERHPNDLRSFLSGPGLRILLGVGAGYVSRRLWTHNQDIARAKIAELEEAPTIPISSLSQHFIPKEGQLALIKDGVVAPLSSIPSAKHLSKDNDRLYSWGAEVVVKKMVEYTVQPKEFEDVFKGTRGEDVSRVPFAIQDGSLMFGRGGFVIVKNVDVDQLPLTRRWTTKSPLDPPATLTHKVVKEHKGDGDEKLCEERVATSVVEVKKVTEMSALKAGASLENVFGILRLRKGMAEIEPSPLFPKKCFTMSRSKIKREVLEEAANANVYPIRSCSVGVGLVSLGLLFSGFYSYASS